MSTEPNPEKVCWGLSDKSAFGSPINRPSGQPQYYKQSHSPTNDSTAYGLNPPMVKQLRASSLNRTSSVPDAEVSTDPAHSLRAAPTAAHHLSLRKSKHAQPFAFTPESTVASIPQDKFDKTWFKSIDQRAANGLYSEGLKQLKTPTLTRAERYCVARKHFLKAAQQYKHGPSMYRLAIIEREGHLGQPNEQRALEWLDKAAKVDEPRSLFLLAQYYYKQGYDFTAKGVELFKRASELTHPLASRALAEHYRTNQFQNPTKAESYAQLAKAHAEKKAMINASIRPSTPDTALPSDDEETPDSPMGSSPCFGPRTRTISGTTPLSPQ